MKKKIYAVDLDSGLKISSKGNTDKILKSHHMEEFEEKVREVFGTEKKKKESEAQRFLVSEKDKDKTENKSLTIEEHDIERYRSIDAIDDLDKETRIVCVFLKGELDRIYIAVNLPFKEKKVIDDIYLKISDYWGMRAKEKALNRFEDYLEAYLLEDTDNARKIALEKMIIDPNQGSLDKDINLIFSTIEPEEIAMQRAIKRIDTSKRRKINTNKRRE